MSTEPDIDTGAPAAGGSAPAAGSPPAPAPPPADGNAPSTPPAAPAEAPKPAEGGEAPKAPDAPKEPTEGKPDAFKIPDEYKDKGWAAKVKSLDDLFKQVDSLDALKGKKSLVPDLSKATEEEREAFYAQVRPKDKAEYVFDEDVTPEMKESVGELLYKNGVSATQANEIIKGYRGMEKQLMEAQFSKDGFEQTLKAAFGDDWAKVTGQTRQAIKGLMNASDQAQLDHLPNAYLGVIYRTLGNVVKAYGIKETDTAHFQDGGSPAPSDVNAVRQSLRDQMTALSQRPYTEQEMQGLRDKLAETYKNDPRIPR